MTAAMEIKLTKGKVAIVDAADFDWLSQWKWCTLETGRENETKHWMAVRGIGPRATMKIHLMHRVIMRALKGQIIDHINRDPLDNRRSNMRFCTQQENTVNRPGNLTGHKSSRFKGVYWQKDADRWRARFQERHIGLFDSEEAAAMAYDVAAHTAFPDHAFLNFAKEYVPSQVS